jgi:hypothetical protein
MASSHDCGHEMDRSHPRTTDPRGDEIEARLFTGNYGRRIEARFSCVPSTGQITRRS